MSDPDLPDTPPENGESFGELLSQFEKSHTKPSGDPTQQREATVVAVQSESVILDIGYKSEGILPLDAFRGEPVAPGDKYPVTVRGRTPEGYYELSRARIAHPTNWSALERAFADQTPIEGTVTAVVKGGLSVDVGVRAFMPASRSGARDTGEMEKLVGQEIRCRVSKLDVRDEDVVVDRRAILEEEQRSAQARRYSELNEGDTVSGTVRSIADYGAFVDLGGIDGLLHVAEMSWSRVKHPSHVVSVGDQVEARVLKIDHEKRRVSLGLKQLQPQPWDAAPDKYRVGERVRGLVSRVTDFGAFVELEAGVEGLIHISEMSWSRKVRKPEDVVKPGDRVETVILGVNAAERRISLGLKQALGDPWVDAAQRFPVGSVIEGAVTNITKFGAFVQIVEGIEGMIHVSEISAERRVNHPQDLLKAGQIVKAQVIGVDPEKRTVRLSIKQLVPTGLDEYLAEHVEGDIVTGRVIEAADQHVTVELGEGIQAICIASAQPAASEVSKTEGNLDLSSLSLQLAARWKGGASATSQARWEPLRAGQVRSFRIAKLDRDTKKIELVPVG